MNLDPAYQRSASGFAALNFQLDDLSVDVFEVGGSGLTLESLTGGYGMTDRRLLLPPLQQMGRQSVGRPKAV